MAEESAPGALTCAIVAVLFSAVLVTAPFAQHLDALKSVVYVAGTGGVACLCLLALALRNGELVFPQIAGAYLAFVVLSFLSLLWSRRVYDLGQYLSLHLANLALLVLVSNAVRTQRSLFVAAESLSLLAATVSAVAVLEYLGVVGLYGGVSPGRMISTLGNPAYLGGFLTSVLAPACALVLSGVATPGARRPWLVVPAAAAALISVVALILSASRAAIIGSTFSLLVVAGSYVAILRAASSGSRRRRWIAGVGAAVVIGTGAAAVALNPAILERFGPVLAVGRIGLRSLFANRIGAWQSALRIWLSQPPLSILFGRGLGSYYALGFSYFPADYRLLSPEFSFKHAHCEYLELLADGGLVSLLGWLAVVGFAAFPCIRVVRDRSAATSRRLIAAGLLAGIAGVLVQNTVDLVLRTTAVQGTFYFVLGLCSASYAISTETGAAAPERRRFLRPLVLRGRSRLLLAAAAVLCLFAAPLGYELRYLMSEHALREAYDAPDRAQFLASLEESLRWNPRDIYALYEKMWAEEDDPVSAIRLADQIEAIIPGYRRTAWVKGIAQTMTGDYRGADATLTRYLGQEEFDSVAAVNRIACRVVLGNEGGAVDGVQELFLSQHEILMKGRGSHLGLTKRDLRIDLAGRANSVSRDATGEVVSLSEAYVRRLVELLIQKRGGGYDVVLAAANVAVGGLFDELDYGDVGLSFYAEAVAVRRLDAASDEAILGKYVAYADKARELREQARRAADAALQRQAEGYLRTYLGYMVAIYPQPAWQQELAALGPSP